MATMPPPAGAPQPAPQTWMPVVAGVLTIVAGAANFFVGLIRLIRGATDHAGFLGIWGLGAWGIPLMVLGIIAIIGGAFAVQRKAWLMALVGAICALMPPLTPLGILAIIFVSLSQKEFR